MSDIRQSPEELGLDQYADTFEAGTIDLVLLAEPDHEVVIGSVEGLTR